MDILQILLNSSLITTYGPISIVLGIGYYLLYKLFLQERSTNKDLTSKMIGLVSTLNDRYTAAIIELDRTLEALLQKLEDKKD